MRKLKLTRDTYIYTLYHRMFKKETPIVAKSKRKHNVLNIKFCQQVQNIPIHIISKNKTDTHRVLQTYLAATLL